MITDMLSFDIFPALKHLTATISPAEKKKTRTRMAVAIRGQSQPLCMHHCTFSFLRFRSFLILHLAGRFSICAL